MQYFARRDFLKAGRLAMMTTASVTQLTMEKNKPAKIAEIRHASHLMQQGGYGDLPGPVGEVDHEKNRFDLCSLLWPI
jgi:hypothetical protein